MDSWILSPIVECLHKIYSVTLKGCFKTKWNYIKSVIEYSKKCAITLKRVNLVYLLSNQIRFKEKNFHLRCNSWESVFFLPPIKESVVFIPSIWMCKCCKIHNGGRHSLQNYVDLDTLNSMVNIFIWNQLFAWFRLNYMSHRIQMKNYWGIHPQIIYLSSNVVEVN